MTMANSSWGAAYQGDSPSTRTASATYSRFCATATRSNGAALPATSNTFEKAYFLRSSLSSIVPLSKASSDPTWVLYATTILPCRHGYRGRESEWYHPTRAGQRAGALLARDGEQLDLEKQGRPAGDRSAADRAVGEHSGRCDLDRVAHAHVGHRHLPRAYERAKRKGRGLVARVRTVEFGPVDQCAGIVERNGVVDRRAR